MFTGWDSSRVVKSCHQVIICSINVCPYQLLRCQWQPALFSSESSWVIFFLACCPYHKKVKTFRSFVKGRVYKRTHWTDSCSCDISAQHRNTLFYWCAIIVDSHASPVDTDTHTQRNAMRCYNLFNVKAATTCSHARFPQTPVCINSPIPLKYMLGVFMRLLMSLSWLGQTNVLGLGIKDGIVFPDENISQDPELHGATLTKASHTTRGALWTGEKEKIYFFKSSLLYCIIWCCGWQDGLTDLRNIGRCRDCEGVSIESEGDIGHARDVLAVHYSLSAEQSQRPWGRRKSVYWYFTVFQLKQLSESHLIIFISKFWRQGLKCLFTLGSEKGENLCHDGMTHISWLVGWASNPAIQIVDVSGWTNNLGGASVDDGLAPARAGYSLPVDGNTVKWKVELQSSQEVL